MTNEIISKKKLLAIFAIVIVISTSFGAVIVSASTPNKLITVIENGSLSDSTAYTIFKIDDITYAKNGFTGEVELSNTNSAIVIQYCINSATDGGIIHIKTGLYGIDRQLNVTSTRIIIEGEGYASNGDGTILYATQNITLLYVKQSGMQWGFGLRSIQLDGNANASIGMNVEYANRCNIYDVMFWDFSEWGCSLSNVTAFNFNGCKFMQCGLHSNTNGGLIVGNNGYANGNLFDSCQFDWCGVGIIFKECYGNTVQNCIIEGCWGSGIRGLSEVGVYYAQEIYIQESYFELNNLEEYINASDISIEGQQCAFWTITNCIFIGTSVTWSIAAKWMTGPINIEYPRIYGSLIYMFAESGTLLGVSNTSLAPESYPLKSGVVGLSKSLFTTFVSGHVIVPINATEINITHTLGVKPSVVILTRGEPIKTMDFIYEYYWTTETVIHIYKETPENNTVILYWVAYK